jgi:hypothetical protein
MSCGDCSSDGTIVLSASERADLGVWLLKVCLLLAHPASHDSTPGLDRTKWEGAPADLYAWMVDGSPPPPDLSVWIYKQRATSAGGPADQHIPLPTVVSDGVETRCRHIEFRLRFLNVTCIHHPGWALDHPLVATGSAVRVWPPTDGAVDIGALPDVADPDFAWIDGPLLKFAPGRFPSDALPPLSVNLDPLMSAVPGVVFGAAPKAAADPSA